MQVSFTSYFSVKRVKYPNVTNREILAVTQKLGVDATITPKHIKISNFQNSPSEEIENDSVIKEFLRKSGIQEYFISKTPPLKNNIIK